MPRGFLGPQDGAQKQNPNLVLYLVDNDKPTLLPIVFLGTFTFDFFVNYSFQVQGQ